MVSVKYNKETKMTEEKLKKYLAEKSATEHHEAGCQAPSPFKVPDGYFDTLCDRVMSKLPEVEEKKKTRLLQLPRHFWQHAAATLFAVATISLALYESSLNKPDQVAVNATISEEIIQSYEDDSYVNEALDYAMIDNSEIAAYLTGY